MRWMIQLLVVAVIALASPFLDDRQSGRTRAHGGILTAEDLTESEREAVLRFFAGRSLFRPDAPAMIRIPRQLFTTELHFAVEPGAASNPKVIGAYRRAWMSYVQTRLFARSRRASFSLCDRDDKVLRVLGPLPAALNRSMTEATVGGFECLATPAITPGQKTAVVKAIRAGLGLADDQSATVTVTLRAGEAVISLLVADETDLHEALEGELARLARRLDAAGVFPGFKVRVVAVNSAYEPISSGSGASSSLAAAVRKDPQHHGAGVARGTWGEWGQVIGVLILIGVVLVIGGELLWTWLRFGRWRNFDGCLLFYTKAFSAEELEVLSELLYMHGWFVIHEPRHARVYERDGAPVVEVGVREGALAKTDVVAAGRAFVLSLGLNAHCFGGRLFAVRMVERSADQQRLLTVAELPEAIRPPMVFAKLDDFGLHFGEEIALESVGPVCAELKSRLEDVSRTSRPALLAIRCLADVGLLVAQFETAESVTPEVLQVLTDVLDRHGPALLPSAARHELRCFDWRFDPINVPAGDEHSAAETEATTHE